MSRDGRRKKSNIPSNRPVPKVEERVTEEEKEDKSASLIDAIKNLPRNQIIIFSGLILLMVIVFIISISVDKTPSVSGEETDMEKVAQDINKDKKDYTKERDKELSKGTGIKQLPTYTEYESMYESSGGGESFTKLLQENYKTDVNLITEANALGLLPVSTDLYGTQERKKLALGYLNEKYNGKVTGYLEPMNVRAVNYDETLTIQGEFLPQTTGLKEHSGGVIVGLPSVTQDGSSEQYGGNHIYILTIQVLLREPYKYSELSKLSEGIKPKLQGKEGQTLDTFLTTNSFIQKNKDSETIKGLLGAVSSGYIYQGFQLGLPEGVEAVKDKTKQQLVAGYVYDVTYVYDLGQTNLHDLGKFKVNILGRDYTLTESDEGYLDLDATIDMVTK